MTSIIQSNRERKSRLDEGLVERLNKGSIDESGQNTPIYESKHEINDAEMPKIKLNIRNTLVRTRNQQEYDKLMQICEAANIQWHNANATEFNAFRDYRSKTCIYFDFEISYQKNNVLSKGKDYYSFNKFILKYDLQDSLQKITEWFDKYKADRKSRG